MNNIVYTKNNIMDVVKNIEGLPSSIHDKMVDFVWFEGTKNTIENTLNFIESINDNKKDFHKYGELKKAIVNLQYLYDIKIVIKRAKNTLNGNPRYQIVNYDNDILMDKLINQKVFKQLKRGIFTAPNAGWVYQINHYDTTYIYLNGIKIKFINK